MPSLPTDPSVLLAYPAFAWMVYLGANMFRRQRDADARQRDLAQLQLEVSTASVHLAQERETAALGQVAALEAEVARLQAALRRCSDDLASAERRRRGAPGGTAGGRTGP